MNTFNHLADHCADGEFNCWTGWASIGVPPGGSIPAATSDPGAVSWAAGRTDVFVRGADNNLWHSALIPGDGQGFLPWASRGAPPGGVRGGPDVASSGSGVLMVFARGVNTGNLYWIKCTTSPCTSASQWSAWADLGAPSGGATSDPSAFHRNGEIHLWVRGGDGRIREKIGTGSPCCSWSGWGSPIANGSESY